MSWLKKVCNTPEYQFPEVYHGSKENIVEFKDRPPNHNLGIHFGTKDQAENLFGEDETTPFVKKYTLNIRNPLRMRDLGGWEGHEAKKEFEQALGTSIPGSGSASSIINAVRRAGYDSIVYENRFEGDGDSYIVFSPDQIREII